MLCLKRTTKYLRPAIDIYATKIISKSRDKNQTTDNSFVGNTRTVNKKQERNIAMSDQAEDTRKRIPGTWLRVYPAVQKPGESVWAVIFRCMMSQIGLASFLVLWTIIWVFIIQKFEGPFELEVSENFSKQQNQLVIDLATELRQIVPISDSWKHAIERRIEDERMLTMKAVGKGAKLHPGQFWDLSGTFLFMIYVMTALGFGAPVPHTIWGRTSALIYSVLAVPTHIYLMIHASTCVVANLDYYIYRPHKTQIRQKNKIIRNSRDGQSNTNEIIKTSHKTIQQRLCCIIRILCIGRCIPLTGISYYAFGIIAFGLLRNKKGLELALFPLEFTTTGGLEHVEGYYRIIYGFYVEGAMIFLAYTLAVIRRQSSYAVHSTVKHFRLFYIEDLHA